MKFFDIKTCLAPALLCLLAACGGSSSSGDSSANGTSPSNGSPSSSGSDGSNNSNSRVPSNFAEAAAQMETSGIVPVLDRGATVAGVDANNNKIRDDIEAYINGLPDTTAQKLALTQLAAAYTNVLTVDTTSQAALSAADKSMSDAISCIYRRYDEPTADARAKAIEKYSVNTKARFDAYDRYNSAMSGTTSLSPVGGGCAN